LTSRTTPCDFATKVGRLRKAEQFFDAGETIREVADDATDVADAYVTMCVHAGIAAADAICCEVLGEHARGENHEQAVALLKRVRPDGGELARALGTLLGMKTRAGYSARSVNVNDPVRAQRAATKLVDGARILVKR
jgi:hypothetical protein